MKRNERGITLIALIITVIVLLILAGTAISISVSGGDIFTRANEAKNSWNSKVATEESEINNALAILDQILPSEPELPAGWEPAKVDQAYPNATDSQKAPIPKGFKVSIYEGETTIAGGLVIYKTNNALEAGTEGHEYAMTHYDQYVWIPVSDPNDMIMCRTHGASVTLDTTTLQCPTCGANTQLAGKLYHTTGNESYNASETGQTYTQDSNAREPDLVTGFDTDANVTTASTGVANATALRTQLETDFDNMARSVAKYGGFYVGRYEIGCIPDNSGEAVTIAETGTCRKGQTVLNAGDYDSSTNHGGVSQWYGLYKNTREIKGGATSTMIWGCQYDQVMAFVNNKKDGNGVNDFIVTSYTETARHTGNPATSGQNLNDLVQNIYDLEGNFYEWTAEAYGTYPRVVRGGGYDTNGRAAGVLTSTPNSPVSTSSSRPGLFINL